MLEYVGAARKFGAAEAPAPGRIADTAISGNDAAIATFIGRIEEPPLVTIPDSYRSPSDRAWSNYTGMTNGGFGAVCAPGAIGRRALLALM